MTRLGKYRRLLNDVLQFWMHCLQSLRAKSVTSVSQVLYSEPAE